MQEIAYKMMKEHAGRHFWYDGREKIILGLLEDIIDNSVERIIDYGCGTGKLISSLTSIYPKKEIHGADISESAIEHCMQSGLTNITNLNINEPKKQYYDLILCCDVLEHILDEEEFLNRLKAMLRTEGKILFTVPAYNILWSGEDYVSKHFRRYTKRRLIKTLARTEMSAIQSSYFNILLFFPLLGVLLMKRVFQPRSMYKTDIGNMNRVANLILAWIFASERWLLKYVSLPFGASIIVVAKTKK